MDSSSPRSLVCHYNLTTVTAALVISLLGSFTSTQLMSQARGARTLPSVFIWTGLSCLIFGFCGTWCLHFLGMLSCEFDVPIGLDPVLTALSALVAVSFTFIALSWNLIQQYRQRLARKRRAHRMSQELGDPLYLDLDFRQSSQRLLRPPLEGPDTPVRKQVQFDGSVQLEVSDSESLLADIEAAHLVSPRRQSSNGEDDLAYQMMLPAEKKSVSDYEDAPETDEWQSRLLLENGSSIEAALRRKRRSSQAYPDIYTAASHTLYFTAKSLLRGLTAANGAKGLMWSIALTNMHFMGVKALRIPGGYVSLHPVRVVLCAMISWSVCFVGVVLMDGMQVNIKQQVLFSVVAATGVAAVHFSGGFARGVLYLQTGR